MGTPKENEEKRMGIDKIEKILMGEFESLQRKWAFKMIVKSQCVGYRQRIEVLKDYGTCRE